MWPERCTINKKRIADSDLIFHYYNCVDQLQLVPKAIGIILFDEHGLILHLNQGLTLTTSSLVILSKGYSESEVIQLELSDKPLLTDQNPIFNHVICIDQSEASIVYQWYIIVTL